MVQLGAKGIHNEDEIQGFPKPMPGQYHVFVKDVDESLDKFNKIIVEFEVLAGTTPGQVGRGIAEFFALTEKSLPRLQRLALVLGLIKPNEPERDIAFTDAIGRNLVIEVEENNYEKDGKSIKSARVSFLGFWSTNNKAVEAVPRGKRKEEGDEDFTENGDGPSAPEPQTPPPTSTTTTSTDEKWADL